jgi:hypothetical protein
MTGLKWVFSLPHLFISLFPANCNKEIKFSPILIRLSSACSLACALVLAAAAAAGGV